MRKNYLLTLLILFASHAVFSSMLIASPDNKTVQKAFRVTNVEVSVTPQNFSGDCPKRFDFTARITVTGLGTVRYRWIRSDGATAPEQTLNFSTFIRTRTVTSYWELGAAGKNYRNYWKAIEILAPNPMVSERAVFNLSCLMKVVMPMREISGRLSAFMDGHNIGGRKVKVVLRRGVTTVMSQELSLDRTGNVNYAVSSSILLTDGRYTITVEKGASDPENYTSTANWCFDGTTPASRTVTIDASHTTHRNQDFTINYYLAWDRPGICW